MAMGIAVKIIYMTLCGAILLAPQAFSQGSTTEPPPKGVQRPSGQQGQAQSPAANSLSGRQASRRVLPGISRPITLPASAPARKSRTLSKQEIMAIQSQLEKESAAVHTQSVAIKSTTPDVEKKCAECIALEKQAAALQVLKRQMPPAGPSVSPTPGWVAPVKSAASSTVVTRPPSSGSGTSPTPKFPVALAGSVTPATAGNAISNRGALAPGAIANVCLTPQIHRVNGASSNVVFTQDPTQNDYIVEGCKFGDAGGQVYLSGAVATGRINMVVISWSDSLIEVKVDPALAGVLDGWPDLIVQPTNQPAARFANCRFYAQRQIVSLKQIPLNSARLANVNVETEYCASSSQVGLCMIRNELAGTFANGVDRESLSSFAPGQDEYYLDSLAPGFVVQGAGPAWYGDSMTVCKLQAEVAILGDSFEYSTQGHYAAYKKGDRQIVVEWGVEHCAWKWMGIFSISDFYSAGYSLQVTVQGPLCVDPWTGKPDQGCIADIKKKGL
jgi:hypothetical protein